MLDEARYFKGKTVVKSILNELARLKFNTFHWHLTDDQGWRIEIKKYPLLTVIGSKRADTQIGGWDSKKTDNTPHAGFYTQEEIKEIVAYAEKLHINIIPEIEMPGHSSAAVASYSWLGVTKQPIIVPGMFGVHYNIFDVTDPKVIGFLEDVLTEVMGLFPSKIIHIGGDEVKYNQWSESPKVQEYMKAHNLSSPSDLQVAFTNQMSAFVTSKGRRMMGWNDIMGINLHEYNTNVPTATGKLSPQTIVQFWKGDEKLINQALEKGYDIVNSYHVFTYVDYGYKGIPMKKAYDFDPVPANIDPKYHKQILGLGAQMWSEWIPTVEDMQRQTFPKIAAYAEVGWTNKDKKNFDSFSERLNPLKDRWKQMGIAINE